MKDKSVIKYRNHRTKEIVWMEAEVQQKSDGTPYVVYYENIGGRRHEMLPVEFFNLYDEVFEGDNEI